MNFGEALEALKAGKKVRRREWDAFLFIKEDEDYPFPVIYVDVECLEPKTYTPQHDDLLAEDWVVVLPRKVTFDAAINALKGGSSVHYTHINGWPIILSPECLVGEEWIIVED